MSSNPWSRHFQYVWEERAGDERLPLWFRVMALAYGMHRANGHAPFGRGQVALVLFRTEPATGEVIPATRQNLHRAIQTAMAYGVLGQGSSARCLVVPPHAIQGGMGGPLDLCPYHSRQEAGR